MDEETPPRPFPDSLCHRCQALRTVKGARSTFLMCTALAQRYPPQPVVRCPAFQLKPGT